LKGGEEDIRFGFHVDACLGGFFEERGEVLRKGGSGECEGTKEDCGLHFEVLFCLANGKQ
jgi:hypothetical protein